MLASDGNALTYALNRAFLVVELFCESGKQEFRCHCGRFEKIFLKKLLHYESDFAIITELLDSSP